MYQLAPPPDLSTKETDWATWENGFSDTEVQRIRNYGDALPKELGYTGTDPTTTNVELRKTQVSWIQPNNDTMWFYNKLGYITNQINGQFFGFDLFGFVENIQYTTYQAAEDVNDHYGWHMDKGLLTQTPRKLSLVLQLSDADEYEGGELELWTTKGQILCEKKKGLVYLFPSWLVHQVRPITKGTRRSLVIWVNGPKFK